MKIALFIEDGLEQIVLTPESDTERHILAKLTDAEHDISLKRGSFYECRGGYLRQGMDDASTMIVMRPKPPPLAPHDNWSGVIAGITGVPQNVSDS
jgi:hypothetical protein